MRAVKEFANAKINLYLDVTSRREDGFHDIKTIMHSISLSDEITVYYNPSSTVEIRMYLLGDTRLPQDERNLAYRAAALFLETAKLTANIEIHLKKKIPIAAGLAGGSSDAAATLRAMNKLFGRIFSNSALISMAAKLGSDVPYCLFGKTALCEGRGEIITRLDKNPSLNVLILNSGEYVKTPEAYATLDSMYNSFADEGRGHQNERLTSLIKSINAGNIDLSLIYNIFEDAVLPRCPVAKALKERLISHHASFVLMSGSGPTVFGIFENEEDMLKAEKVFRSEGVRAYAAKTV